MKTQVHKPGLRPAARQLPSGRQAAQLAQAHPETGHGRLSTGWSDNSPRFAAQAQLQAVADASPRQTAQRQRLTGLRQVNSFQPVAQAKWILNKEGKRIWVPEDYELKEEESLYKGEEVTVENPGQAEELILRSFNLGSPKEMCEAFAWHIFKDIGQAGKINLEFSVGEHNLPRFTVLCPSVGLRLFCNQEDVKTMRLDSIRIDPEFRGTGKTGPQTIKCLLDLTKRNTDLHRWILVAAEELGPYAWASMGWSVRSDTGKMDETILKILGRFKSIGEELENPSFFLKKKLTSLQVGIMQENALICECIANKQFEKVPKGWGSAVVEILTLGNPKDCMFALTNIDKRKEVIFIPRLLNGKVVLLTLGQALLLVHDIKSGEPSGAITWEGELNMKEGDDLKRVEKYLSDK